MVSFRGLLKNALFSSEDREKTWDSCQKIATKRAFRQMIAGKKAKFVKIWRIRCRKLVNMSKNLVAMTRLATGFLHLYRGDEKFFSFKSVCLLVCLFHDNLRKKHSIIFKISKHASEVPGFNCIVFVYISFIHIGSMGYFAA